MVQIKRDIFEGGDHVLGGRMRGAGNVRSLLSSDGADGLGGATVWIHWSGIDQSMFCTLISILIRYYHQLWFIMIIQKNGLAVSDPFN